MSDCSESGAGPLAWVAGVESPAVICPPGRTWPIATVRSAKIAEAGWKDRLRRAEACFLPKTRKPPSALPHAPYLRVAHTDLG